MSTRIADETLLLSKYLSNNSNKAAEVEKTAKTVTTSSGKTTNTLTGSKYDTFEVSSLTNPSVYNSYNAQGQYESIPSLVDYLDEDNSSSLFENSSSSSGSDLMELLGSSGGSGNSLADFITGGDDGSGDYYDEYFSSMSSMFSAKVDALIKEAMAKLEAKESTAKAGESADDGDVEASATV